MIGVVNNLPPVLAFAEAAAEGGTSNSVIVWSILASVVLILLKIKPFPFLNLFG